MEGDFSHIGLEGKRTSGQKVCSKCLKTYNNRAVPEFCETCKHYLGGKFVKKDKKDKKVEDAQLITATLASVRANPGGRATRSFVDVSLNQVKTI